MSDGKVLKCGVIGYGGAFNMGKAHLTEMQLAGMIPTAVTEIDPGRLAVATTDFPGIQTYSTVADMLAKSDVQVIAIITPHNTHAPLAIQCLNAKKHVVSEKPFAITTQECDDMIAAAKANGVVVSTYHNRHWDGHILTAIEQILVKKSIGDIVRISIHWGGRHEPRDWWRSDKVISGGILYDWGVHVLEYALQLVPGAEIREVSGFAHNGYWLSKATEPKPWHKNPNEDDGHLVVRLSTGVSIDLTVTSLDPVGRAKNFEILGTDGHFSFDMHSWSRTTLKDGIKTVESGPHAKSESHKLYQNIADHLLKGEKLIITPEWARRMIHIIDLAGQSAKAGRTLSAKYV